MPSVRTTTASSSPRAAHRSSENQYGPIMAHALDSVRRRLTLAGPAEGSGRGATGFLSTSRHRRLRLLCLRPAAIALEAIAPRQRDAIAASPGSGAVEGH